MGWQSEVAAFFQAGNTTVINSSGTFVYNGVPALGNLVASMTPGTGTDPYGNIYRAGLNSYSASNGVQMVNGFVSFFPPGIGTLPEPQIFSNNPGQLTFESGQSTAIDTSGAMVLESQVSSGFTNGALITDNIVPFNPSSPGTPETWHAMTLLNSWANAAGNVTAQYRLLASPINSVEIIGSISATAATAITFATLPTHYIPAHQQQIPAGATGGLTAGSTTFVQCDTSGNLTLQHGTIGAADTYVFHGTISLDA